MFYSMFLIILQYRFGKIAVKCQKICPFQNFAVILYPIKIASIGNWHKNCITEIKILTKITFLIKQ